VVVIATLQPRVILADFHLPPEIVRQAGQVFQGRLYRQLQVCALGTIQLHNASWLITPVVIATGGNVCW